MPDSSLATALAEGPVVLDGGLATQLEAQGHDLSSALWSARLLDADPDAIVAAHAAFSAAGAQVATTASYQASVEGFAAVGVAATEVRALIAGSVELARRGAPGCWVAGSVGPYGAVLADGSEYTGSYVGSLGVPDLRAFHRPRMELLAEAEAVGMPVWLSLTTVVDVAGVARTRRGERAADVFAMASGVDAVVAVGVNCTAPSAVVASLAAAASAGKPLIAYPNSGEGWDAAARRWTGTPGLPADDVPAWTAAGARLVGGCCRVGPTDIAALAAAVR